MDITDSAGSFAFSGLPAGNYRVRVNGSGFNYTSAQTNVTVTAEGIASNVHFQLRVGSIVEGLVTGTNGIALTNLLVIAYENNVSAGSSYSDDNGYFQIKGLSSGSYRIQAQVSGQNYLSEWYDDVPDVQEGIPAEAAAVAVVEGLVTGGLHFALSPGGEIAGSVRNKSGAGLSNIWVQVVSSNGTQIAGAESNEEGAYRISGLRAGGFYLKTQVNNQNYFDQWYGNLPLSSSIPPPNATRVQVLAGSLAEGIDFELPSGSIVRGTVRNREGGLLAGASIEAREFHNRHAESASSDSNGCYEIDGLPGGSFVVSAAHNAQNYLEQETALHIEAEESIGSIDFALAQGCVIQGFVTHSAGTPILTARVRHQEQLGGFVLAPISLPGFGSPNVDSNGFYRISGLSAGEYIVSAAPFDDSYSFQYTNIVLSYEMPTGTVNFCLVTASVARICGVVKNMEGQGIAQVQMAAINSNGSWAASAQTETEGEFTLALSAGGTYFVRTFVSDDSPLMDAWYGGIAVTNGSGSPMLPPSAAVTVMEGEVVSNLVIELSSGCTLSGRVTDNEGIPLDGITVKAVDHITGFAAAQMNTTTNGRFALQGLYPAAFKTYAGGNGYLGEWFDGIPGEGSLSSTGAAPIAVSFENTPTNIDFFLSQGATLCVCASNRYEEPLEGAFMCVAQASSYLYVYYVWGDTDENGRYEARGLSQQDIHVVLSADGYESQQAEASLTLGATTSVHFVLSEIPTEAAAPALRHNDLTFTWAVPPLGLYRIERSTNLLDWSQAPEGGAADQKSERLGNPSLRIEYRHSKNLLDGQDFYRLRKLP
ncbi:MAG: hypothetical protein A2X46_19055 [Lentisphaerae bacterium GWF2_57_35]|nr:MAG: hypothetical protein A2X46_19055 [Lentisphaerae bacterium GWF2_57_35]